MSIKYYRLFGLLFLAAFTSLNCNAATFYNQNNSDLLDFDDQIYQFESLYEGKQLEYYDFKSQSYKNAEILQIFDNFSDYEIELKDLESDEKIRIFLRITD